MPSPQKKTRDPLQLRAEVSQAALERQQAAEHERLEEEGTVALSKLSAIGAGAPANGWQAAAIAALPALVERLASGISHLDRTSSNPTGAEASTVTELTTVLARVASSAPACRDAIRHANAAVTLVELLCALPDCTASVSATQCLTFMLFGDDGERSSAVQILEATRRHAADEPLARHRSLLALLRPVAESRLLAAQKGSDVVALETCIADGRSVGLPQGVLEAGRERMEAVTRAEEMRRRKKSTNVGRRNVAQSTAASENGAKAAAEAAAAAEIATKAAAAQAKKDKAAKDKAAADKRARDAAAAAAAASPAPASSVSGSSDVATAAASAAATVWAAAAGKTTPPRPTGTAAAAAAAGKAAVPAAAVAAPATGSRSGTPGGLRSASPSKAAAGSSPSRKKKGKSKG